MGNVSSSTGLLICVPTLGRPLTLDWAWAFKSLSPPINYNTNFLTIKGKPVDVARNEAAEAAIAQNAKYLFFMGDDTVPPAHGIKQLIYTMEQHPEIGVLGGIYFSKTEPPAPLVFRGNGAGSYWDWKIGELFEVTGLGMDCTIIRTECLKQVSSPRFKTVETDGFLDGVNSADLWTEDLYFCKKVIEETQFKIYADAAVICSHDDVYSGKRYGVPSNSLPTRTLQTTKLKAIDIGSGPQNRASQFPEYDLVRVDIREDSKPDYRCDVRVLPFGNDEFDLVFSSHVLEHMPRKESESTLREWVRILKPDGKLILCLPNVMWALEQLQKNNGLPSNDVLNVLYGAQSYSYDFHYNAFTPECLTKMVLALNCKVTNLELQGYNIILEAVKINPSPAFSSEIEAVTFVEPVKKETKPKDVRRKNRKHS